MAEIATLGLRVDGTANIDKATQSLGRFTKSGQEAEQSTDSLSKGSQRTSKSLSEVARQSETASRGMSGLASAARSASTLIVASLGGLSFGRVISETAGFEQSLLGLQVVSGATAQQMEQLERQSRQLGATSMFSAQQAADAQNYLAMAGFNVNEVLSATPGLLELAAAGSMDLASAADLASNVLGGMGLAVSELGRVNDVLAAAAAGSNTSIMQLGQALSYAAPIAASAGISIEETAAAIGVLSDSGLQASRAGTGLLGFIRQLSNITPQAEAALASYGLTVADVNIEQNGLVDVLGKLQKANINTQDSFKIFQSEAGVAANILAAGAVRVNEFTGELELAEGAARRAALILGSGLQGSFKSLTSAIGESTLQLGRDSGLSAGLQEVIDYATGVISVYNGMLDIFQDANDLSDDQTRSLNNTATALALAAGATGGLSAAYVILTGAIWAANTAMTAFMRLLRVNPLVLLASAAVALGGALFTARNRLIEIGETTGTIGDYLLGAWQEVTSRIQDYWADTVDNVVGWLDDIGVSAESVAKETRDAFVTALDVVIGAHRMLFNTAVGIWYAQQTVVMGVVDAITKAFTTLGTNARTIFSALWQDIQAIMTLDFSTSHLSNALESELLNIADVVGNSVSETLGKASEQLTADHLGNIVSTASGYFDDLGTSIENRVATNQQIAQLTDFSRNLLRLRGAAEETGETVVVLGDSVTNTVDTVEKLTKAQRDAQKEAERFQSSLQSLVDTLFPVEAAQRTYREEQEVLTRAWNEGTITAERYTEAMRRLERAQLSAQTAAGAYGGGGGFGSEIGSRGEAGSPTDPLARSEDEDYWTKWLESAETALTDFDALAANTAENFQQGFGNAFESMIFDSQSLQESFYNLFNGIARSLVSALGEMAAQWLAYQAVQLLVGKTTQATAASGMVANALAQQQMAGLNAFASTAAIPIVGPVVAPAAMAAAIAATAPSVAAITSLSAAGMAHDGIDRIPREGTWLLDQGERVVSRPQADRLDAYLSRQERPQQSQPVAPVVNVIENPNRAGASEQRQDQDGKWVIDIFVANIQQGGKADKAIRSNYGLSRQGV